VIRVNLLPQKKRAERSAGGAAESSGGQRWLLVVLGVVLLEIIGFLFFHQTKTKDLQTQMAKNAELDGQIATIRQLVVQHEQVKKDLLLLKDREQAIQKLEGARTGPTAAMLELSRMLTPGKGPTVDPDRFQQQTKNNPLQAINPSWDPHRVWLGSFKEKGRVVEVTGFARDSTDVSELAYRLKASSYFYDVKLLPGRKDAAGPKSAENVSVVAFGMQLKVRY
jgi:type IV pilus assembly protein PilN